MYHLACICGESIISTQKLGLCPGCGKAYRIEWQDKSYKRSSEPKTIAEKYEDS